MCVTRIMDYTPYSKIKYYAECAPLVEGMGYKLVDLKIVPAKTVTKISAIHGITLSAWAFAGLTGNQMASYIVNHVGEFVEVSGVKANPQGYQTVLIVTTILYAVAMCLSLFLVRPMKKVQAAA